VYANLSNSNFFRCAWRRQHICITFSFRETLSKHSSEKKSSCATWSAYSMLSFLSQAITKSNNVSDALINDVTTTTTSFASSSTTTGTVARAASTGRVSITALSNKKNIDYMFCTGLHYELIPLPKGQFFPLHYDLLLHYPTIMHRTPSENEPSPKKIDWTFSSLWAN